VLRKAGELMPNCKFYSYTGSFCPSGAPLHRASIVYEIAQYRHNKPTLLRKIVTAI
jgi:hypothetical protein